MVDRAYHVVIAALLLSACASSLERLPASNSPSDAERIGAELNITYRVTANRGDGGCSLPGSNAVIDDPCYEAEMMLSSDAMLDMSGATIHFSQVDPVALVDERAGATISHANGDLHSLAIQGDAAVVAPDSPLEINFVVKGLALTRAKFMPNYYVVDADGDIALIKSTREVESEVMGRKLLPFLAPLPPDLRLSSNDLTPLETAVVTYAESIGTEFVPEAVDAGIIPTPANVKLATDGQRLDLSNGISPRFEGIEADDISAAFKRLETMGVARKDAGLPLHIEVSENLAITAEGYELDATPAAISIRASDTAGAFYALQSLSALATPGSGSIPALAVEDEPRFAFRGLHLDIARNFQGPDVIRALIDQMAAYKLNKLHLHLADDEGWRLEIKGLPELTDVGARRCHDPAEDSCLLPQLGSGPDSNGSGTGFLSEPEYIALLRYAAERNVEIIPALDMPGHARAAVKSMEARYRRLKSDGASEEEAARFLLSDPQDLTVYSSIQHYSDNTINVCRASAYRFAEHVIDRLIVMHAEAETPLRRYHIGADETAGAWIESPICAAFLAREDTPDEVEELSGYFIARVAHMVSERGVIAGAWSDGLSDTDAEMLPSRVQSNIWGALAGGGASTAHHHANSGWDVVLSIPDALYFDLPYAAHPDEGGYFWAIRRAPTRKLFTMMPENLPAMAAYWKDREERPIVIDLQPLETGKSFAGIQGQIWSETVRDPETLGYQLFPRMYALAERAWHRAEWEVEADVILPNITYGDDRIGPERQDAMLRDWNRFASILTAKELPKLENAGWAYRLPAPGVIRVRDRIKTVSPLPGLLIECNNGNSWVSVYDCSTQEGGTIHFRTTNPSRNRAGRTVELTAAQQ